MPHLLLIIACVSLFFQDQFPYMTPDGRPPLPDGAVAACLVGPLVLLWLIGELLTHNAAKSIDRTGSLRRASGAARFVNATRPVALAVHVFAVVALGWLAVVRDMIGDVVLLDELVAILPFATFLTLSSATAWPVERRLREASIIRSLDDGRPFYPVMTRAQFTGQVFRHQILFVLVPIAAIFAWVEAVYWFAETVVERDAATALAVGHRPAWAEAIPSFITSQTSVGIWVPIAQLSGLAIVFAVMPVVLRRVFRTTPLLGDLRERLVALCAKYKIGVRDLLVWHTYGTLMNGAVMGLLAPMRYILLTDALLDELTDEELEAVAAHEVAHVVKKHMIWLAVALTAALSLGWTLAVALDPSGEGVVSVAITIGSLALALVCFGFVSRRFEWQADAFAARHLSAEDNAPSGSITDGGIHAMAGALGRVARLNSIPINKRSWRHGSIAMRQRKLAALAGLPADRLPIDRQVRVLKALSLVLLVVSLGAFALVSINAAGG